MGNQKERMLAGEIYIAAEPDLAADCLRAMDLVALFNASPAAGHEGRMALLGQ